MQCISAKRIVYFLRPRQRIKWARRESRISLSTINHLSKRYSAASPNMLSSSKLCFSVLCIALLCVAAWADFNVPQVRNTMLYGRDVTEEEIVRRHLAKAPGHKKENPTCEEPPCHPSVKRSLGAPQEDHIAVLQARGAMLFSRGDDAAHDREKHKHKARPYCDQPPCPP